jgi:hypothetical protein
MVPLANSVNNNLDKIKVGHHDSSIWLDRCCSPNIFLHISEHVETKLIQECAVNCMWIRKTFTNDFRS